MRWRLLASLSALCALSGLVAGCGARHAPAAARGGTTRAKSPGVRSGRGITRARALAFARAVNLTAADIPEASISHEKGRTATAVERREIDRCEGPYRHERVIAELNSPKLTRGEQLEREQIRSYVAVVPSGRKADEALALVARGAVRACFARSLGRIFARENVAGARWGRVSVLPLSAAAPGADAAVGIRVGAALNIEFNEVSVPLYVDVVAFALGHAEVAMSATSITQPVPASTEHELLALLLARAKAHPL